MTVYQAAQRVRVFDPKLQRHVDGDVLAATSGRVLVALDDRMCPITADPADRFRISPLAAVDDVPPCTGCSSPSCPDCRRAA